MIYRGDSSTDPEDVHRYALRRAAKVASNYGYRYFVIEGSRELTRGEVVRTKDKQKIFIEDFWSDHREPIKKTYERIGERKNHGVEFTIKCFASHPYHQEDAIDAYSIFSI